MVFTKILFIRGIIASNRTLRVLMGRRFPELWDKYQEDAKEVEKDGEDPWWYFVHETDGLDVIRKKLGLEIHTWPCCSELNAEMFVIGVKYGEANVWNDMAEAVTEVPKLSADLDQEITDKIMGYSDCLDVELKSVMLLDDCTSCS